MSRIIQGAWAALLLCFFALPAGAQNFVVQCPGSTLLHPNAPTSGDGEPVYNGPAANVNPSDSLSITGSIGDPTTVGGAGTTLTVTAAQHLPSGALTAPLPLGTRLTGPAITPGTYIAAVGTVNAAGLGTYTVNNPQLVAPEQMVGIQYLSNGGAIKCQQVSGGDGFMTEADGNQTFMFAFGPLSGLGKIQNGQPGTDYPDEFNQSYCDWIQTGTDTSGNPIYASNPYNNAQPNPYVPGAPDPLFSLGYSLAVPGTVYPLPNGGKVKCDRNGAVGYVPSALGRTAIGYTVVSAALTDDPQTSPTYVSGIIIDPHNAIYTGDPGAGYTSPPTATIGPPECAAILPPPAACGAPPTTGWRNATARAVTSNGVVVEVNIVDGGWGYLSPPPITFSAPTGAPLVARTDPAAIMNTGVLNGNIPAPLMAIDEDDEFFLTLTNVGRIMRPDLFEQHTIHFHGYPNASSFYDGVPDASVAINIGASFTYYYLAPDAGTYFWHCHITPPEHLQMGMVGQLFVRPRQNRAPNGVSLNDVSQWQQGDLRTACYSGGQSNIFAGASGTPGADILCSTPAPVKADPAHLPVHATGNKYVYNDGDGSTRYDIDVPIQIHGFDPNFHFVGQTFNEEGFADMKNKYFLLNGRSYPDTVTPGAMSTQGSDGNARPSQPLPTLITLSNGTTANADAQRAALRIADLDVAEYQTLASLGIPMQVVGYNAKLLRDQDGNNLYYTTNSITLGGGESLDVILDACAVRGTTPPYACTAPVPAGTYFLYTPNLDHLSNDAENFGGLMTEVVITN